LRPAKRTCRESWINRSGSASEPSCERTQS
jgi:hypothetical protein